MRRTLSIALLAVGGLLGVTATASADIGDIRELSVDANLLGDASSVEVTGSIRCAASIEYGFSGVGVAQNANGTAPTDEESWETQPGETHVDADTEGVGAYGPNFDPPVGISDDSPCSQSLQSWDVLIQQNRDSGDFVNGDVQVAIMAGTSAEDGDRGPGPFIGDLLYLDRESGFDRTR